MRRLAIVFMLVTGLFGGASDSRAQFCPGVAPWVFDDVLASDPFCGFITKIAQQEVTLGCLVVDANHRLYCPNDSVTRNQMAAFMARLGDALFPLTCLPGQLLKWNGSAWTCASDNGGTGGGGTVTSVTAGTGLQGTPSPITGSGSLAVAASYRLPQACTNGQVPKSNGSGGWACAADSGGSGTVTSVTAGTGLTGGVITGSGTIAADPTYVQRRVSATCAVGSSIRAIAADGTVTCQAAGASPNAVLQGGNSFSAEMLIGTNDNQRLSLMANAIYAMRFQPHASGLNIIGGPFNDVTLGAYGATIAGGGDATGPNRVTDRFGTVDGGRSNRAGDDAGTTVDADGATVSGGLGNWATSYSSTVIGGASNWAKGHASVVLGGLSNRAFGDNSVAMGSAAVVNGEGSFLFADSSALTSVTTSTPNEFAVAATGGIAMATSRTFDNVCRLAPGGGSWACTSDRSAKRDFAEVDPAQVLDKVVALPISTWRFKTQPDSIRHMGPMAQDFREAFSLGTDDITITQVDVNGVTLAAIQGLNAKLEATISEQAREIAALKRAVELLIARAAEDTRVATR